MPQRKNRFKEWLGKTDSKLIAKALAIDASAVRHWKRGHSKPSTKNALRIVAMTVGRIQLSDIFGRAK